MLVYQRVNPSTNHATMVHRFPVSAPNDATVARSAGRSFLSHEQRSMLDRSSGTIIRLVLRLVADPTNRKWLITWLVVLTILKNISQWGSLFPIYGKIKNVPNHQPVTLSSP